MLVSKVTTQKFKMVQSENIFWIFCAHWIFFRHVVSLSTNSDRRCKLLQYLRRTPRMSQMRGFHTFLSTLQRCKLYLSDFNFLFLSFNLQMFFLFLLFYLFFNSPQDHHLVRAVLLDPLGLLDLLDLTGIVNVQLFNKRFAVPAVVVANHGRTQEVNKVVFVVTAATVLGLGLQDQILQDLQDLLILHRTHLVHFHHLFHYQIQTIIGSSYQI